MAQLSGSSNPTNRTKGQVGDIKLIRDITQFGCVLTIVLIIGRKFLQTSISSCNTNRCVKEWSGSDSHALHAVYIASPPDGRSS